MRLSLTDRSLARFQEGALLSRAQSKVPCICDLHELGGREEGWKYNLANALCGPTWWCAPFGGWAMDLHTSLSGRLSFTDKRC
jgi:hypothetical protein